MENDTLDPKVRQGLDRIADAIERHGHYQSPRHKMRALYDRQGNPAGLCCLIANPAMVRWNWQLFGDADYDRVRTELELRFGINLAVASDTLPTSEVLARLRA